MRIYCSVGRAILPAAGFRAGSALDAPSRPAGWKAGCSQDWLPHLAAKPHWDTPGCSLETKSHIGGYREQSLSRIDILKTLKRLEDVEHPRDNDILRQRRTIRDPHAGIRAHTLVNA